MPITYHTLAHSPLQKMIIKLDFSHSHSMQASIQTNIFIPSILQTIILIKITHTKMYNLFNKLMKH